MPYVMKKNSDGKWCVHKKNDDGSAGENRGCSDSKKMAKAHMRALYAHEGKEMSDKELTELIIGDDGEEADTKETAEKSYYPVSYPPPGIVTFAAYDEYLVAQNMNEQIMEDAALFKELALNIAYDSTIEDKASAMSELANEFTQRIKNPEMHEMDEEKELDEKAVLSGSSRNDLPDSAFLYVEPGGKKDDEGKTTPRSKRHLPVKDSSGKYDLAHVRNAIDRIPQMKGVSADKKKALQARARAILAKLNKGKEVSFADELIMGVSSFIKSKFPEEPSEVSHDFMLWKEGSRTRFLVRYSNNFRDEDSPPEIISEASHQHFVRAVENKEAEMPELWLWHVPEWRVGLCDWLAYDDSGFALASGLIDVGKEVVTEQIAAKEDVACSHGMPTSSIERDTVDPTVIVKHITKEISLLPLSAAANKRTSFVLLGSEDKEDDQMAIPTDKRQQLEGWGVGAELLDKLEAMNKEEAEKAVDEGIERKEESSDVSEQAAPSDTPSTEQAAPPEAGETETPVAEPTPYPTREEIAEAFTNIFTPFVDRLSSVETTLADMSKQLKENAKEEDEKVEERIKSIPPASLAALLSQQFSAIGSKEAKVDGRDSLAKSGPKEAPDEADERSPFFIPFIRDMVSASPTEE